MTLRFGPFLLNPDRRDLLRDGERVSITPKVFDLLVTLVEHRDRVVDKRELLDRLWPDAMIEEATLVQTVSMLRKAIGCSRGDGIRYIATIPGRGYQFVGAVQNEATPPEPPPSPRRNPLLWLAPAILLAAALLSGWYLRRPSPTFDRPQPLTSYPGREIFPSFSPDGNRLAFQWEGETRDNWDIYTKVIGQDAPQRLTQHPADDWSPAWSPDGRHIALVRRHIQDGVNELLVMPSTGGPERSLLRGPLLNNVSAWNQLPRLVAWHPDSRHLIVSHSPQEGQPFALWAVSLANGELRQLTHPPPKTDGDVDPAVSPDGRRLAFRRKLRGWTSDVFLLNLSPNLLAEGEPVLAGPRMFSPAWAHDGSELFLVESPARPSLWRLPGNGKGSPARVSQPSDAGFPAISANGKRYAYAVVSAKIDLWQAQLTSKPGPRPFIASTYLDMVPDFSPDGKRIAFTSARSGNIEIWTANADGSQAVQLTHHNTAEADCPTFSPDGTKIVYHANLDNFRDVMLIDAAGGSPRRLTYKEGRDVAPSWSRDGKWIYYASGRSGGRTIWKISPLGGDPLPVTSGSRAEESTDGKTLFVDDAGALWSMPIAGGPRTRLLTRNWANANFRVRQNGIFILSPRALQFYDFQSKQLKEVFPTPNRSSWGLAISPDASRVLFTQSQPEEADVLTVGAFR